MPGAIAFTRMPLPADLGRERLREHRDRRLRHAVARERRRGRVDRARRDVDDVARALRDHVPDRGLASVEDALQVDREDALELLVGAVGDHLLCGTPAMLPTMSTRPNSDAAPVDERVDVGALRHVGALHDRGAARGLDLVGRRLGARPRRCRHRRSWRRPPPGSAALALPMPLPTPVSTATFPERSNISCTLATLVTIPHSTSAAQPTRGTRVRSQAGG